MYCFKHTGLYTSHLIKKNPETEIRSTWVVCGRGAWVAVDGSRWSSVLVASRGSGSDRCRNLTNHQKITHSHADLSATVATQIWPKCQKPMPNDNLHIPCPTPNTYLHAQRWSPHPTPNADLYAQRRSPHPTLISTPHWSATKEREEK